MSAIILITLAQRENQWNNNKSNYSDSFKTHSPNFSVPCLNPKSSQSDFAESRINVPLGSLFNFLLTIILIAGIYIFFGKFEISNQVNDIVDGSPAQQAGIITNDKIISINNTYHDCKSGGVDCGIFSTSNMQSIN